MAFRRGFKSAAPDLAGEVRLGMGIGRFERLDPRALADWLAIPIIDLSSFERSAPEVGHLLRVEPRVFSAVTVLAGPRRTIVHNDAHSLVRQNSIISHELSHGLLQHPPTPTPTPALDDSGCRVWNQDIEDEASWLAGCILVTPEAALAIARGRWTAMEASEHFGVSEPMIQFRTNATGAAIRVRRASHVAVR